jgi:hypothetical protein
MVKETSEWYKINIPEKFRPSYNICYPASGDPYIEFIWRENELPKRYKLELFIEKLASLGILEELPEVK